MSTPAPERTLCPVRVSCNVNKKARLDELSGKVRNGEGLNMAERLERQGLIFNHAGTCGRIVL